MTINDTFTDDIDTTYGCACDYGNNGCDMTCLNTLNNDWAQTTCCQCATADQCQQVPPNDVDSDSLDAWQGCDLYAPDINIADAVETASAPGMWFTSAAQLNAYLEATVSVRNS